MGLQLVADSQVQRGITNEVTIVLCWGLTVSLTEMGAIQCGFFLGCLVDIFWLAEGVPASLRQHSLRRLLSQDPKRPMLPLLSRGCCEDWWMLPIKTPRRGQVTRA